MAKFNRTSRPPEGAHTPTRNTRLYGSRDEQIAGASLRSKGQPDPRYQTVTRKRSELVVEHETRTHRENLQRAQVAMLQAQDRVRAAKRDGEPYAELGQKARSARSAYLTLLGGVESRTVEVAQASDANKVKAV